MQHVHNTYICCKHGILQRTFPGRVLSSASVLNRVKLLMVVAKIVTDSEMLVQKYEEDIL